MLHAEVRIEITQGVDSARPIGVVPFKWAGHGTPPEDIGKIVGADLRNSGKFNPIDVARMPQQPTSASEVTPAAGLRWASTPWLSAVQPAPTAAT